MSMLLLFPGALNLVFALVLAEVHSVRPEGQVALLGEPYAVSFICRIHDLMLIGTSLSAIPKGFDL